MKVRLAENLELCQRKPIVWNLFSFQTSSPIKSQSYKRNLLSKKAKLVFNSLMMSNFDLA